MNDPIDVPGRLVRQWAACGIAVAAARFIPVPLLDDAVRERATRVALTRALRAHGHDYPAEVLEPLYGDVGGGGWASGAVRSAAAVAGKIVRFPVRKYVAVFGAVRGVPTDVMRVLLLARTVYRRLAAGELADIDHDAVRRDARALRRAFDAALDDMDLRLLTGALAEGLSQGRDLTAAATRYARRGFGRADADADAGLDPGGRVAEGADTIEGVLRRPEIAPLLVEFDARVDAELAAVR